MSDHDQAILEVMRIPPPMMGAFVDEVAEQTRLLRNTTRWPEASAHFLVVAARFQGSDVLGLIAWATTPTSGDGEG